VIPQVELPCRHSSTRGIKDPSVRSNIWVTGGRAGFGEDVCGEKKVTWRSQW